MSSNKSSLEETTEHPRERERRALGGEAGGSALRNGVAHYQRAALMLSHAETLDSLRRAQAAFSEAGETGAAERCAALLRVVEAGGTDELPSASELLR